ncbi:MAG: type II secretion system F family protein [Acidimicrobiales bacterium]
MDIQEVIQILAVAGPSSDLESPGRGILGLGEGVGNVLGVNPLLLGLAIAVVGIALVGTALLTGRRSSVAMGYLRDMDGSGPVADTYSSQLGEPFLVRVVKPMTGSMIEGVRRLTPRHHLDKIARQLSLAGLSSTVRAEDFLVGQAAGTGLLSIGALGYALVAQPPARIAILLIVLAPAVGLLAPPAWLARKVRERHDLLRRDLPDTLDLLAISVEAGVGFEGAMAVVCQHFNSPLASELGRTLREMELGLPRKEAFTNLKRRTEVPELSNLVLALLQADALGIPVGRVLKTQAAEMRNKRRQWAREKAGKLPVKMLFPLVAFVFPSILVVVLGPAAGGIMKALQ